MENRRAYYGLLLINFAAAFYNVAAQWLIQFFVIANLGPWRMFFGVLLVAFVALVTSILIFRRKPRGISNFLLGAGVGIQVIIWVLLGFSLSYQLPLVLLWLELILTLAYAILAWRVMIKSRQASIQSNRMQSQMQRI